jgi:hypothetical protein
MALRDFGALSYVPYLSLRPAEMRALEELPNRTKDIFLPLIHLRPWGAAHQLDSSVERIANVYGNRPIAVGVGYPEPATTSRPVHSQLQSLRDSSGGFRNWCDFVAAHPTFIPAIQFGPAQHERTQTECLYALGRGLFVVIERAGFAAAGAVAARVAEVSNGGVDVCFVLDFLRVSQDHLFVAAYVVQVMNTILEAAPESRVCISASSFPDSFASVQEQPIYERRLFNEVEQQVGGDRLIYSDRGSARAERQQGGGGTPNPRIDYPQRLDWRFYRSDFEVGFDGYRRQARALMADPNVWNPNIRVWGTQMIERTAAGDTSAISSPARSTAARINLHLQVQTFYADPAAAEETDEEWED